MFSFQKLSTSMFLLMNERADKSCLVKDLTELHQKLSSLFTDIRDQ